METLNTFVHKGKKYIAVNSPDGECTKCEFKNMCIQSPSWCSTLARTDNRTVIWVKLEEQNETIS